MGLELRSEPARSFNIFQSRTAAISCAAFVISFCSSHEGDSQMLENMRALPSLGFVQSVVLLMKRSWNQYQVDRPEDFQQQRSNFLRSILPSSPYRGQPQIAQVFIRGSMTRETHKNTDAFISSVILDKPLDRNGDLTSLTSPTHKFRGEQPPSQQRNPSQSKSCSTFASQYPLEARLSFHRIPTGSKSAIPQR